MSGGILGVEVSHLSRTQPLTLLCSRSPHCTEPAAACRDPSLSRSLWSSRTPHPAGCSPLTTHTHTHTGLIINHQWIWLVKDNFISPFRYSLHWWWKWWWWWWDDGDGYVQLHVWWMTGLHRYSQLSSCRVHTCLSMGYLVRSMLQAIVAVMLLCVRSRDHYKTLKTLSLLWCTNTVINNGATATRTKTQNESVSIRVFLCRMN